MLLIGLFCVTKTILLVTFPVCSGVMSCGECLGLQLWLLYFMTASCNLPFSTAHKQLPLFISLELYLFICWNCLYLYFV